MTHSLHDHESSSGIGTGTLTQHQEKKPWLHAAPTTTVSGVEPPVCPTLISGSRRRNISSFDRSSKWMHVRHIRRRQRLPEESQAPASAHLLCSRGLTRLRHPHRRGRSRVPQRADHARDTTPGAPPRAPPCTITHAPPCTITHTPTHGSMPGRGAFFSIMGEPTQRGARFATRQPRRRAPERRACCMRGVSRFSRPCPCLCRCMRQERHAYAIRPARCGPPEIGVGWHRQQGETLNGCRCGRGSRSGPCECHAVAT